MSGKGRMVSLLIALLISIALAGLGCSSDSPIVSSSESAEVQEVIFMAGFKPQANLPFVAAYIAKEKGYFAEQGMDVEIRHASAGEHLKLLLAGDVQFTTSEAGSVLRKRSDSKVPIVSIALFGQKGQNGYVALASSGIKGPSDWEDKTFGYKTSVPPEYLAILESQRVDRSKIREVSVGYDPRVLTEGQVDILSIFKSNEPNIIRGLGHEVVLWDPADFGIETMGLTYITHNDLVMSNHDLVLGFLKATLKGFHDALANPDEALDIVMLYAPDENRDHQQFMLMQELADAVGSVTEQYGLGWMTDAQWKNLHDQLVEYQAITESFDYRDAFDLQFLKEAYDGGVLVWP